MKQFLFVIPLLSSFFVAAQTRDAVCKTVDIAHAEQRNHQVLRTQGFSNSSDNFDVKKYRCDWDIDPANYYISGNITTLFTITTATNNIVFDLLDDLTVDSVRYHQQKILYTRPGNHTVVVQFPASIAVNVFDSVTIFYRGVPGSSGFGTFVAADHSGVPCLWTLSEPYGSREWWPCKNGTTDKADSIEIIIHCPDQYTATTNGKLQSEISSGGIKTCRYTHYKPIASYLIGIACTNYARTEENIPLGTQNIPMITYSFPEEPWATYIAEGAHWPIDNMKLFHELIGDYPFDQYTETEWAQGGGMEHQTNSFVFWKEDVLSAHELAHQWFGDKITNASWRDIWIHEGFATYFSYLQFERNDPAFYHNSVLAVMNSHITDFTGMSVYVDDTTDINRIFHPNITYEKGSFVCRMLRGVLGDSTFFRALRYHLNKPSLAYSFGTTETLRQSLEEYSGVDLKEFMRDWVYGQGYPSYHLLFSYNNDNGLTRVVLGQTQSHPSVSFFEMPVELTFVKGVQTKTVKVNHTTNNQVFWVDVGFDADTVLIDPNIWIISKDNTVAKTGFDPVNYNISVYPNPFSTQFTISVINPPSTNYSFRVYNAIGQLMWKSDVQSPVRNEITTVPSQAWAPGMYILKLVENNNEKIITKLIKGK